MMLLTVNPQNPRGPLLLIWWETTGSTILAEVM